jgi:hypothetical protein
MNPSVSLILLPYFVALVVSLMRRIISPYLIHDGFTTDRVYHPSGAIVLIGSHLLRWFSFSSVSQRLLTPLDSEDLRAAAAAAAAWVSVLSWLGRGLGLKTSAKRNGDWTVRLFLESTRAAGLKPLRQKW